MARALMGEQAVVPWSGDVDPAASPPAAVDLVLLPEVTRVPGLAQALRRSGVPAATLRLRHLGELPQAVQRLGQWLGKPRPARELASSYLRRIQRVRARTDPLPEAMRPPVVVWVWANPPVWAGPATPPAVLVRWAGGRLVTRPGVHPSSTAGAGALAGDTGGRPPAHAGGSRAGLGRWLPSPWRQVSWWPGGGGWLTGPWTLRGTWPQGTRVLTPLLRAAEGVVGKEAVLPPGLRLLPWYHMPPGQLLAAGPDTVHGLERMAAWLHPELFPDLDVEPLQPLAVPSRARARPPSGP